MGVEFEVVAIERERCIYIYIAVGGDSGVMEYIVIEVDPRFQGIGSHRFCCFSTSYALVEVGRYPSRFFTLWPVEI